jgi:hypothetical protein
VRGGGTIEARFVPLVAESGSHIHQMCEVAALDGDDMDPAFPLRIFSTVVGGGSGAVPSY